MKASKAARRIATKYGTNDVFAIAAAAGARIVYESWYPTTIGEFEPETKTILVNRRALDDNKNAAELEKIIIAHELGHLFAADFGVEKADEERFAREFARELTRKEAKID